MSTNLDTTRTRTRRADANDTRSAFGRLARRIDDAESPAKLSAIYRRARLLRSLAAAHARRSDPSVDRVARVEYARIARLVRRRVEWLRRHSGA